jgi:hypothetical protein
MEGIARKPTEPEASGAVSPLMAVKLFAVAGRLGLNGVWSSLWIGRPTQRKNAYLAPHRIQALLAGLACGLTGIASGNLWIRNDPALRDACGGAFPDQGTIHRWLSAVDPSQVEAFRQHLFSAVKQHGRFRQALAGPEGLVIDLDAQGIVANGQRFEQTALGWMNGTFQRGYQRLVCYCATTREVLDERLEPGNASLMTAFSRLLDSLNELFTPEERSGVLLRGDGHAGTVAAILRAQKDGYRYLLKLQHSSTIERLRKAVANHRAEEFETSSGVVRCWDVSDWKITNKDGRERSATTRVVLFQDPAGESGCDRWWGVAVNANKPARELWQLYRDRGGAIEEYFDQSFRAYHLDVKRTSPREGLELVHLLAALCWNLLNWELSELSLPPARSPNQPDRIYWIRADRLDLEKVLERSRHSGIRFRRRTDDGGRVMAEDAIGTLESRAWSRWLNRPTQRLLRLAG